jgi:hypothetical protein
MEQEMKRLVKHVRKIKSVPELTGYIHSMW